MDLTSALFGLGSTAFGYFLKVIGDYYLEDKKQKEKEKQFRREKLERAFMVLEDFNNKVTSEDVISLREGEYNSNELSMIIRFYFNNIHKEYSNYLDVATRYGIKIKIEKPEDSESKNYYKEYKEIVNLLVRESKKL